MREINEKIAAALASGTTTLCRCWLLERRDGERLGFTDHDAALSFDGVTFEPESGFARSALERSLGLSVDNMEAAGALRSDAITEADLAWGLYDGASIRQWLVDWTDVTARDLGFAGTVGEVRRSTLGFAVEVSGLSEVLNQPQGRVFLRACDAELGDARCAAALSGDLIGAGVVTELRGERSFVVSGLWQAEGWFSLGRLAWTGGGNAGETVVVHSHGIRQWQHVITLWGAPHAAVALGDAFDIRAGCDKSAATCRAKFDNILNFRGFPHMPGEDWATGYPSQDEVHDGGSLFRG
jgi:uncharacterized phage protein (TIGR02218 family)